MKDFSLFFKLGWDHIISFDALDHILFISALSVVYLLSQWKQVLLLVTAFTIGHAITLVLSVFNIIRFNSGWVEFAIPCTIVATSVFNLIRSGQQGGSIRLNYVLASGFGLIHGMGYANAIRFMLADQQEIGWPLFSFNLGLEIGQIVVVLLILLLTYVLTHWFAIKRRDWVIFLSSAIFALALEMAITRFPLSE